MSNRIPQSFIDELLARVDIVDVIEQRVPLKKAGKDFSARCPFHDEKTPSFTVVPSKQFYHCFGCGASGSAITFLMEYENLGFRETIEELARRAGLEIPQSEQHQTREAHSQPLLDELLAASRFYQLQLRKHPRAKTAIEYLKGRGVSGEIAAAFQLGYAPPGWENLVDTAIGDQKRLSIMESAGLLGKREDGGYYDRFRDRIIYPIHDQRGRIIGFGGRIIDDGEPKYLNSPETPLFHKGTELYGLHQARGAAREAGRTVVVEGYMDVIALVQAGVENVVATLGTATTSEHLRRLFRLAPEIVFCFDGDRAGRTAAWRALETCLPEMERGRQVGFLFLPEGDDPDTLVRRDGRDALLSMIENAAPLPAVFFKHMDDQVDLGRLDGRARFVELAMPLIRKIPAGAFRDLMEQGLKEKSGVSRVTPGHGTDKPATKPTSKSGSKKLSFIATAISLLLQNPRLALMVSAYPELTGGDEPGMDTFRELLALIDKSPEITTARLVEQFRGSDKHRHLENLAARDHHIDEDNVADYFADTLKRIDEKRVRTAIADLRAKADSGPEDRRRLAELMAQLVRRMEAKSDRQNDEKAAKE